MMDVSTSMGSGSGSGSSSSEYVKGAYGTAISISYSHGRHRWWWVGLWAFGTADIKTVGDRLPRQDGWHRERHPDRGAMLFSVVTWNGNTARRLTREAVRSVSRNVE
jgi:hypothetical protein